MNFFEKITDGLFSYEIVALFMGILMFFVLLILLIIFAGQRRSIKPLLLFFIIPVLLMVWPSIVKLKIDNAGIEINKAVEQYTQNPSIENKDKLKRAVADISDREVKDPEVMKTLAVAQYKLNEPEKALTIIQQLPQAENSDQSVVDIKKGIKVTSELDKQLEITKNRPTDSVQIKKLDSIKEVATNLEIKNPEIITTINKANSKIENYKKVNPRFRPQIVR